MAALCCRVQERSHSNALHSVAPKPGCAVSSPPLQEYKELLKELSTLEAPRRSQTILWPSGVDGHTNSFPHVRSLQCCTYADHLCTTCDNMSNLIIDNVTFGFWRGKTNTWTTGFRSTPTIHRRLLWVDFPTGNVFFSLSSSATNCSWGKKTVLHSLLSSCNSAFVSLAPAASAAGKDKAGEPQPVRRLA